MTTKELCYKILKKFVSINADELSILEEQILDLVQSEYGEELEVNQDGEFLSPKQ